MKKLYRLIEKELEEIECHGLTAANIGLVYQMVDILKDICEIHEYEHKYKKEPSHLDKMNEKFDEYMSEKLQHPESHERLSLMLDALMGCVCEVIDELEHHSDNAAEKEIIKKHRQQIGERAK